MSSTTLHPLEPLTAEEIQHSVALLRDAGNVTPTTRFVSISLKEPSKEAVQQFTPKSPPAREAFVVLFDNAANACYEVTLSLSANQLLTYQHIPNVQPTMTIDEQIEYEQAVLSDPEFKALLKERYGIEDTALIMVDIWSAGYYGTEEDRTMRLARPLCFLRSAPTDNGYARPLEALRPTCLASLRQRECLPTPA